MITISDKTLFSEIVAKAIASVNFKCGSDIKLRDKWIRAIGKATVTLEEGDTTFMHWDKENHALIYWSATSNNIYSANGTCQCKAFERAHPCYHRAMSKLIETYLRRSSEICLVKVFTTNHKRFEQTSEKWIFGFDEAKAYLNEKLEDSVCVERAWIESDKGKTIYEHVFPESFEYEMEAVFSY